MHYKVAAFFHLKPPEGTPTPKWMARRALKTARQCDQRTCESVSSFCEAVLSGKLPQYYFSELKRFKSYSDALPSEGLVGEWHPDYPNMKCKGNTIIGISLTLQATADEGLIKSEYVLNAIERYKLQDWSFHKGKYISRTTPEEIKLINDTLDTVMGYLESEYGLEPQKRWVPYRAGQGEPYTVGEAKSILERLRPASDDDVRPFYEAIANGALPAYILGRLNMFKSLSDELPAKKLHGGISAERGFKCRVNAQAGINSMFSSAIDEGVIKDEKVIDAINIYWKWLFHRDNGKLTTKEEIRLINTTLDIVIDYLKKEYGLQ